IPIMAALAEKLQRPTGAVMIPLSFVAILGGMTTLIGSSTNLLVSGAAEKAGLAAIGFFDFAVPGVVLASVGMIYSMFILPRIMPDRSDMAESFAGEDGKQFIAEIDVAPGSILDGEEPVAGMFKSLPEMTVRLIQRGETAILPPFDDLALRAGDVVIVAATRKALADLFSRHPVLIDGRVENAEALLIGEPSKEPTAQRIMAEVVVAPASRLDGRTLALSGFRAQTGCIVLGIQRRSRMIRASMNEIRLEAGDVLLVTGRRNDVNRLRDNKDVLLLEWSTRELPRRAMANRALLIFGAVVGAAATGILPIEIAALSGAGAMIIAGALNVRQASRAVDRRVVLLVAAALAMGTALQATGGAAFVAHGLVAALSDQPAPFILSAFFLLVAALTNILSNNATAVLFTPIAVGIANELGMDPLPFIYAVIFGANCSFATPIAYQTNLLVMGPGHYQFIDFVRAGTPLILLLWLVFSFFMPLYFDIG
ncbi:MAG: SLC13 family permease, partial [Alphaproteobacteria bacterium]|nr:SLC13 family permease [Alphaproteobacteria bacterium]